MSMRHKAAGLNGLEVWMFVQYDTGTPGLTRATGSGLEDSDISLTDTGSGDCLVTINPFKGPKGEVYATVSAVMATGAACQIGTITYTGDSLAIQVLGFDLATPTAADNDFMLHLYAE